MIAESKPLGLLDATAPPEYRGIERDRVRLLVTDRAARTHTHARFDRLPCFLREGDLLVVNDSATLPAAIIGEREGGARVAVHVSSMIDERLWTVEPRGAVEGGEEVRLAGGGRVRFLAPVEPERPRLWYAWFALPMQMDAYLAEFGAPIRYRYVTQQFPLADYQTLFARIPGSSEMPSAARPFTARVIDALRARGVEIAAITLHCGVASFEAPERPALERYALSSQAAQAVNRARAQHRRVIAVGTTALRALESSADGDGVVASSGWTDLVIDADYHPRTADALLTGFHDSAATHQWIIRAFLERDLLSSAYQEATERGYYQHEFGDIHLIL